MSAFISRARLAQYIRPSCHIRTLTSPGTSGEQSWLAAHLQTPQAGATTRANLSARQRRIMFRSRQRGWLELDVLLGRWADAHVPQMKEEATIAEVEQLLDAETPHLFRWIIGQELPPQHLDNDVMRSMKRFAKQGRRDE